MFEAGQQSDSEPGRPPSARDVRPALDVWVDVPQLLRAPSGHRAHTRPGIAVGFRAQGVLLQWAPVSTGAWLALVRYRLESTDGQGVELLHYVPADLVTRRTPRSTRRAK